MTRNISFAPREYYHLYNRGTDKRNIFSLKNDYERFTSLLYLCNSEQAVHIQMQGQNLNTIFKLNSNKGDCLVEICAYCLMPNHFHLLVREKEDKGISRFMQKLTTGYTMYFNKRHDRNGSLFQGTFKSRHVSEDRYLSYLISFIHLNPIKILEPNWKNTGIPDRAKANKFLENYPWSSYQAYFGIKRPENVLLETKALPEYAENFRDFKTMTNEWLKLKNLYLQG